MNQTENTVDTLSPIIMQDVTDLIQTTNSITLTDSSIPSQLYQEAAVKSQSLPVSNSRLANNTQKSGSINLSGSCDCCGKNSGGSCGSKLQNNRDPCCVVVCLKTLETLRQFVERGCCSGAENSLRALALQISERSSSCCSEKHK